MAAKKERIGVLFVCMGNICRSPTAEGVFRKLVSDAGLDAEIEVDSAGTHAYHTGEPPDRRAQAVAERRGYTLKGQRARRVADSDFQQFDFIMAMDRHNLSDLEESSGDESNAEIRLFLEYSTSGSLDEVPDPYYGGAAGFERVLDLVEDAAAGLLDEVRRRL